jgi:hypothetical protein
MTALQKRIFGARRRWEEEAEKAFRFSSTLEVLDVGRHPRFICALDPTIICRSCASNYCYSFFPSTMRFTVTAAFALAIATSLAAAREDIEQIEFDLGGPATKKSSTTTSTKSSKSDDCTSCTAGTLTRSNMVTSLFFNTWSIDGYINQDSVSDYCTAEADEKAAFVQAVGYSAGCLIEPQCLVNRIFGDVKSSGANITEGVFGGLTINTFCYVEQNGSQIFFPEGDCVAPDPCLLGSVTPVQGQCGSCWAFQ